MMDMNKEDWEPVNSYPITAAFQTITTPLDEMLDEIYSRGWEMGKVEWGEGGYVARAKNPHGEELEGTGPNEQTAVGNLLSKVMRRETARSGSRIAGPSFSNKMAEIAQAYLAAPVYDPSAVAGWKELGDDSVRRVDYLRDQIQIEYTPELVPYESAQEMCEDVHKNQHILISTANTGHPVWTADQQIAYRVVHDVLGYCVSGADYGWEGANKAFAAHAALLPPASQKALFTESLGQSAVANHYQQQIPQKIIYLDDFLEDMEEKSIQGIHPSQSLVPVELPGIPPPEEEKISSDLTGTPPLLGAKLASDPNADWKSGIDPLEDNGYVWHVENDTDPLDIYQVQENARKLQTDWANIRNPDGSSDQDIMQQAVIGAFRAALLSPRKDLKWNAVHYQDLQGLPALTADPKLMWDTLEERREAWNQSRGFAPGSHKAHWKLEQTFRAIVRGMYPDLDIDVADEYADRTLLNMRAEEESRLLSDSKSENWDTVELENQVTKALEKRLNAIVKPQQEKLDVEQMGFGIEAVTEPAQLDFQGQEAGKYGAFMYSHLKSISQVVYHIDEIMDAAAEDVQEHGGAGHHFRNKVLQLQIPGVGPKVISLAWLILQPLTSELATLDTHMMEALDRDYGDINDRDYYKFERELRAGRDASGYGHIPLGQFQWGLWDYKRTGPGSHQDHSPLRALNPTPHQDVDWQQRVRPLMDEWIPPEWWEATREARERAGQEWDETVAPQFARDAIPRISKYAYRGWGPLKSFNFWWEHRLSTKKRKFTIKDDSRILAEHALGEDLVRSKVRKFIKEHKEDIRGDWKRFQKAVLKEYDDLKEAMSYYSGVSPALPWVMVDGAVYVGQAGDTYMNLARNNFGFTTMEVWQRLPEQSFSVGTFDPTTQVITSPEELPPDQEMAILQALANRWENM